MFIIKHLRQLVTMAGPARPRLGDELSRPAVIEDGALLIEGEKFAAVGTTGEVEALADKAQLLFDGRERPAIALPGFVDSHTHPVFAATREEEYELRSMGLSYQEIARRGGGILSSVRRVRQASRAEIFELSRGYAERFLEHGTTTIEAKSGYGLSTEDEIKLLEVIRDLGRALPLELVPTLLGAHAIPDEYSGRREEYVRLVAEEIVPEAARRRLARFCDVFFERGYFNREETVRIAEAARAAGLGLRLHADQLSWSGGAELAAELGAVSADHLELIGPKGIEALARSTTFAVMLPAAAFNLGLPFPPARRLIDSGARVALASDFNPGSCFCPNMQLVISIACSRMQIRPAEAIAAATINGAYSLGIGDRVGSIEPGKQADLALFDLTDYRQLPYYFGVNNCFAVIKKGKLVYRKS